MELVVRKNDLLRELQLFQGIVERKNTMPVLANVLLRADGDQVELVATDLDVGLRSTCAAQSIAKAGTLTLPAKKLFEIVKALPETDIRIEQNRSGVTVAAERFESHLSTLPADDFPQLPTAGETVATLPRELIRQMVAKTMFAITGSGSSRQKRSISRSESGASGKRMSAPRSAKARQRSRASSMPSGPRASVRARMRMSAPSSRASTAARMRIRASARGTTDLPAVWPQRFGANWSSIMTAANPARA